MGLGAAPDNVDVWHYVVIFLLRYGTRMFPFRTCYAPALKMAGWKMSVMKTG